MFNITWQFKKKYHSGIKLLEIAPMTSIHNHDDDDDDDDGDADKEDDHKIVDDNIEDRDTIMIVNSPRRTIFIYNDDTKLFDWE